MAESLARFHRLTGIAVDAMPVENRDEDSAVHASVSASTRQVIDRLNRRDRALYERVNTMLGC
jgi:hypothetical protein